MVLLLLQHRLQLPVFLLQVLNLLRHIRIGRFVVGARQNWFHFVQLLELHLQTITLMGQLFDFILKLQELELLLINHGDIRLRNRFVTERKVETKNIVGSTLNKHLDLTHMLWVEAKLCVLRVDFTEHTSEQSTCSWLSAVATQGVEEATPLVIGF